MVWLDIMGSDQRSRRHYPRSYLVQHRSLRTMTTNWQATGQKYQQTTELMCLGGAISENPGLHTKIKRSIGAAWASFR